MFLLWFLVFYEYFQNTPVNRRHMLQLFACKWKSWMFGIKAIHCCFSYSPLVSSGAKWPGVWCMHILNRAINYDNFKGYEWYICLRVKSWMFGVKAIHCCFSYCPLVPSAAKWSGVWCMYVLNRAVNSDNFKGYEWYIWLWVKELDVWS